MSLIIRIFKISAKKGIGVQELINGIIELLPPPRILDTKNKHIYPVLDSENNNKSENVIPNKFKLKKNIISNIQLFRGLIFDSWFIPNKGVYYFLRVFNGSITIGSQFVFQDFEDVYKILELGKNVPNPIEVNKIDEGSVGYFFCNIKNSKDANIHLGKSITSLTKEISQLESVKKSKPILFVSIFPENNLELENFNVAFNKLLLEDPSIETKIDNNITLGQGYRCGFLGTLHLEVFIERLKKEYLIGTITTPPNIDFKIKFKDGKTIETNNPFGFDEALVNEYYEMICTVDIMTYSKYDIEIRSLVEGYRGSIITVTNFLNQTKYNCEIPLLELVNNFNDKIKSITNGYATWDFHLKEYKLSKINLIKVYIANDLIESFNFFSHKSNSYDRSKLLCDVIKENIPNALFTFSIQARIGNRTIASEQVRAVGKNVLSKCYGGDYSRKRKLIEKQKEGKLKMKQFGKVSISSNNVTNIFKSLQNYN